MPIVSHLFDNGTNRGRWICHCRMASPEAKSADFCQVGPPPGAVPRPNDDVTMTSLRHFTYFSVQMLSKCVIFVLFLSQRCRGSSSSGGRAPSGQEQKGCLGVVRGQCPVWGCRLATTYRPPPGYATLLLAEFSPLDDS